MPSFRAKLAEIIDGLMGAALRVILVTNGRETSRRASRHVLLLVDNGEVVAQGPGGDAARQVASVRQRSERIRVPDAEIEPAAA